MFSDLKTNNKYKDSFNKVMDLLHIMGNQYDWVVSINQKIGRVNLQNDKMGLK